MALFNPTVNSPYQQSALPGYAPYSVPTMQVNQQPVQNTSNGIVWVQGENAAKSYPVAPGTTLLMLDSEDSVFYIKTVDASGMPMPLRTFDFAERTDNASQHSNEYITRDEFEKRLHDIMRRSGNENKKRQPTQ